MPGIEVPRCSMEMPSWHGLPKLFGEQHPGCHRPLSSATHKPRFKELMLHSGVLELPAAEAGGEQPEWRSSSI